MAMIIIFALLSVAAVLSQNAPCPDVCTPSIDPNTQVVPVPTLKASCEIIPNYGSCNVMFKISPF